MAKAEQFLAAMESATAAGLWDAAGLAGIHAGISAADAVVAYHGGVRSAAQDHRSAVELLEQTLGLGASPAARHLKRLVDKKNLVEYEQRRLTAAEAADLARHARRFLVWARSQLPAQKE
jgi:hypothetical protein